MQVSTDDAERSGLRVGAGIYIGSGIYQCGDHVVPLVLQTSAFVANLRHSSARDFARVSSFRSARRTSDAWRSARASIPELMLVIANPPAAKNTTVRGPVGSTDLNAQIGRRALVQFKPDRGERWIAPGGL
jgi:hypothetical protein